MARGFTMIELVVVIVILGILAALALPKFLDVRSDAESATMSQLSASLSSAASLNFANCTVVNNVPTANKCTAISNCTDAAALLEGGLPSTMPGMAGSAIYIVSQTVSTTANGVGVNCSLRLDDHGGTPIFTMTFMAVSAGH